jgi:uncharacterized repeat protein (TIGR03837 family)
VLPGPGKPVRRADVFCRVIDNFGDAGICWRLCRQLAAEHGWRMRLWIDRPPALFPLAGLAPGPLPVEHAGVHICLWDEAPDFHDDLPDCVIEAFACRMPDPLLVRLAAAPEKPVWLNLEYLTAEDWARGCHLLDSPHATLPLRCTFFIPGFDAASGGLLREADLLARRDAWRADPGAREHFWATLGGPPPRGRPLVSLFAYADGTTERSLAAWATEGVRATIAVNDELADRLCLPEHLGGLEVRRLPFLDQDGYDRLLWTCDLNLVRGEDSFVRAQWAGQPFLWQPYRQSEGTHSAKLAAFLEHYLAEADEPLAGFLQGTFAGWNDPATGGPPPLSSLLAKLPAWRSQAAAWCAALAGQDDLAARLAQAVETRLKCRLFSSDATP